MNIYCEQCDEFVFAETEDFETYTCPCCGLIIEEIDYVDYSSSVSSVLEGSV